jgi:Ca2+-binding EF-hand superfamily protein
MPRQQAEFDRMMTSVDDTELELAGLVPGPPSMDAKAEAGTAPPPLLPHTPAPPVNQPLVKTGRTPQHAQRANPNREESWMWEETDLSKTQLRQLFTMIDRFEVEPADSGGAPVSTGDGGISSTELMHMLVNLGEDVPETLADEMVDLVDIDDSTEIEFEEFLGVLTGRVALDNKWRQGAQAAHTVDGGGRSIREIRMQFNSIDEDGGGSLDKEEVANLAAKMGQGLKKRHLLDAMKAMDPTDTGEVDFESFKNWLIDTKEGRHWSDFLVLPEGAVAAVRRRAISQGLLPEMTGPASEWQRLSVLLKMLWEAVDVWGSPVDLYGLSLGCVAFVSVSGAYSLNMFLARSHMLPHSVAACLSKLPY